MMKENNVVKYSAIVARVLLGLIFVVFGFGYFFMGDMPIDTATPAGKYAAALLATGFFFPVLKIVEGIAGLMLFFKRWTALALVILAPIIVQILLFNIFLDQSGLIVGVVVTLLAAFLAWQNRQRYAPLFRA